MIRSQDEHQHDLFFWFAVLALGLFGLLMVYSASSVAAFDQLGDSFFLFRRQFFFFSAGALIMWLSSRVHPDTWLKLSPLLLGSAAVGLVVVHIPGVGHAAGGASRWISFGMFTLQPSEFVKLFAALYFAQLLGKKKKELLETFQFGIAPVLVIAGVLGIGMMTQPDFGNTVILFAVAIVSLYLSGVRLRHLSYLALVALPMAAFLALSAGYRRRRLESFLDPWADPTSSSYQILQSFSAFSSGGFWGKGLGNSQEKLFFLPKVHTDFIASIVGEELGFAGVLMLCTCFAFIVWYALRVAERTTTKSHAILVSVLGFMIGLQAFLNFAVVLGLAPTKGLPMPFISYGGSSLVVAFWACGLIQSVARVQWREPAA
ncbi:MAG TPA: putative lipid II flippase FtsW [Bdellovibrionota bacterium]|nr:putative lipid II flippase FtsW [Bdellovibrionota bacterium]